MESALAGLWEIQIGGYGVFHTQILAHNACLIDFYQIPGSTSKKITLFLEIHATYFYWPVSSYLKANSNVI